MEISNVVQEDSFKYSESKPDFHCRSDEIGDLGEIYQFCKEYNEDLLFPEEIWFVEVERDVLLLDWVYSHKGKGKDDDRARLLQYLSKSSTSRPNVNDRQIINVSLGKYLDCAFDMTSYYNVRRKLLSSIGNANEFFSFMDSCFDKIIFSNDIESSLRGIGGFSLYLEEIVNNLSVLNDYGLKIFQEHHANPKRAMEELSAIAERTCSPERSKNFKYCKFSFTLEVEDDEGNTEEITKKILCSPHLKLIHDGSDLRIYFNWNDTEIGKGEKILVGRIGSHPY